MGQVHFGLDMKTTLVDNLKVVCAAEAIRQEQRRSKYTESKEVVEGCASTEYKMSQEQIDALIPIYHWVYLDGMGFLSVHDSMHAQCGFTRTSPHPAGFVYAKAVPDSVPIYRVKGRDRYWHGTLARIRTDHISYWTDVNEGVCWHQPTKGPFTTISSGSYFVYDQGRQCYYDSTNVFA